MWRLLHRRGLTGREPSAAIRVPGGGRDAGQSRVKDATRRSPAHPGSDGGPVRRSSGFTEPPRSESYSSGQESVTKAVLLFFAAFTLYFLTHSPALDEIDAVQFAMGVRSFDLWHHLGAAAPGTRPQLSPVVAVILGIPLKKSAPNAKSWCLAYAALIAACLIWLWADVVHPMAIAAKRAILACLPRTHLRPMAPAPGQTFHLHRGWRLECALSRKAVRGLHSRLVFERLRLHSSPRVLAVGSILTVCSMIAYIRYCRDARNHQFWSFHAPWLLLHIAFVFATLPGDQRYYLMVLPPLLVIMFGGLLQLPKPWDLSAVCVPALLLYIVAPLAIENHREEAPPVRLVRYLEKLYPPSKRDDVLLILPTTRRSAQWYAPQFKLLDHLPTS